MTDEVYDLLHSMQEAYRRGRRTKIKQLSVEGWLEIKANGWAVFTTRAWKKIPGRSQLAYAQCVEGYVQLTRKGIYAVWDAYANRTALYLLDRMQQERLNASRR